MKWFKHDSSAHRDTKIKRLKNKHGIVGYGLYWYCLEMIAENVDKNNVTFELEDDAELIAIDWSLDRVTVSEIMLYMVELGLFEVSGNRISCLKMANRIDDTNSRNPEIQRLQKQIKSAGNHEESSDNYEDTTKTLRTDKTRLDKTRLEDTDTDLCVSKAKKKTSKKKPGYMPDWMPVDKWLAYVETRRSKKHPMNPASLLNCMAAIEKTMASGVPLDEILDRMIETGWRTVKPEWFRDKDEPKKNDNAALAAKINASIDWSQVNEN